MKKNYLLSFTVLIVFCAACSKKPEFKAVRATKTHVEVIVSSVNSGTVKPEREAELAFGAVGRVRKNNVHIGIQVKKDEVLAELENTDLASMFAMSKRDLERSEVLVKTNAISEQKREEYQRDYDMASLALEKSLIRAPFDGLITEVNLEIGQLSQITAVIPKPLIKIIDLDQRYLKAEIDEVDLPKIAVGLTARAKILAVRREPFAAVIRKIIPYVSTIREQDRTSLIELNVNSEGILLPAGASADIEIIAAKKDNVLAVPSRTILGRAEDRFVFRNIDNRSVKTPIKVGASNYESTEILSGLTEGETVLYPSEDTELLDNQVIKVNLAEWP